MRRFLFILLTCCVSLTLKAQTFTVSGKVLDEKGLPLPGANLKVKGGTTGTTSTSTGDFTLNVPSLQAHLIVTYVGYVEQEVDIQGKKTLTIQLTQNTGGLDEVVVVAYGTQKRTSVSGAVSTVGAADLRANVVDNTMNAVTGRAPGVRITQQSSQPGQFASSIDIRGFASYQGDGITPTQTGGPLFVIDGIPTTDQTAFSRLDPNEIESFSVLKDATAAIYGVEAANGVILVTTRKGKVGKVKVDYSGNWGVQVITKYPQLANASQYAQLYDQMQIDNQLSARSNPITPLYSAQQIQQYANGQLPSTNWTNVLFKSGAQQQQHNVTISGGNDKIQSFTSLGYYQSGGEIASGIDGDKKYNLRESVTATLAKGLTADINLGFNDVNYTQPNTTSATLWSSLIKAADGGIPPIEPVYANGNPNYLNQFPSTVSQDANIAGLINKNIGGYDNNNSRRFNSVFSLNYQIPGIEGLSARGMFGYSNNYTENYNFAKAFNEYTYNDGVYTPTLFGAPSSLQEGFNQAITDDLQLSLNYDKHIGKSHFSVLALYEQVYNTGDNIGAGLNYTVDAIPTLSAGNQSTDQISGGYSANANVSYVGKVDYDYAGKYILQGGFRDEGSSYFAPGHQWGFFPYASAAWRISEEPFIKNNAKWIDNIKLRASYGKLGDDAAASSTGSPYYLTGYTYPATANVYASGGSNIGTVFGNTGGITKGVNFNFAADPNLTWYTSKTADIGLESSFWNGKLTFEGDVFRRDRTGLLATPIENIPTTFGATIPEQNINSDRTQGIEFTFGHTSRIGDVTLHVSANVGYNRTQELQYEETPATNPYDNYRNKYQNRYTDQIWGYVVTGQFQNYQQIYSAPIQDGAGNRTLLPGDLMYKDINGDGVINANDQEVIANGGNRPLINFGATIDVSWKAFDLSMLIQGATDYHISFQDQLGAPFFNGADPLNIYVNSWHLSNVFNPNSTWVPGSQPPVGSYEFPYKGSSFQAIPSGANTNQYVINGNTFNVVDGTYARLKQLQLSYTLPVRWYKKAGISKISVVATGYNIFTWTKEGLRGFDPEYTDTNLYGYNYPITANYNLGVHITF